MLKLVEEISGNWHYHISETGDNSKPALCGNTYVMCSEAPLHTWGFKGQMQETYCKKCEEIFKAKFTEWGKIKGE